jgi:hypothetical protein
MLFNAEDKLRYFQTLISNVVFTKVYNFDNFQVVFRALNADEHLIVNKQPNTTQQHIVSPTIKSLTINGVTCKFASVTELDFNNELHDTPLPQLVQYITTQLEGSEVGWDTLINIYYQQFVPLLVQLNAYFNNTQTFNTDTLIKAVTDLMYHNAVDFRWLDLDTITDRNYLAVMLNYYNLDTQNTVQGPQPAVNANDAQALIALYKEMVDKKNAQ